MNVYDFDKTIYNGDATIDFYLFCIKKHPLVLLILPKQLLGAVFYCLRIKDKDYFKQNFYSFLRKIKDPNQMVEKFWKQKIKKIYKWYLMQKENTDVIISASPEFLLKPLEKLLNIEKVIASKVDINTGKLLSKNCYGKEKVKRFQKIYPNKAISSFYSDSLSDIPMARLAKNSYLVHNKTATKTAFKPYQHLK